MRDGHAVADQKLGVNCNLKRPVVVDRNHSFYAHTQRNFERLGISHCICNRYLSLNSYIEHIINLVRHSFCHWNVKCILYLDRHPSCHRHIERYHHLDRLPKRYKLAKRSPQRLDLWNSNLELVRLPPCHRHIECHLQLDRLP